MSLRCACWLLQPLDVDCCRTRNAGAERFVPLSLHCIRCSNARLLHRRCSQCCSQQNATAHTYSLVPCQVMCVLCRGESFSIVERILDHFVTAKLLKAEPDGVLAAALEGISRVRKSCAAELTLLMNARADRKLRVIGFFARPDFLLTGNQVRKYDENNHMHTHAFDVLVCCSARMRGRAWYKNQC